MENFAAKYQQVSNYMQYIGQEDINSEVSETSNSNSAEVASGLTTSLTTVPESQGTLYVPFLGQSNAEFMSTVFEPYQPGSTSNDTSGAIVLDRDLSNITGRNIVTNDTPDTNFAVGGSKVNGNGYYIEDNLVWWYPDQNQPGGALRQAESGVRQWLADSGAQPDDEIAIVWSQGESDVGDIDPNNPDTIEKYKQSTIAVFDYLKSTLGYSNITFYIVPTGRVQTEAAANVNGLTSDGIEGIERGVATIRSVQADIALERDDVQLAPDYADLNMVYEEGQIYGESYDRSYDQWFDDFWHLGHDGFKVNGSRLAQYIALDGGQNNVISFTDSFGNPAESISIFRAGILDINVAENPSPEAMSSTSSAIAGTDNPDLIVGTLAADTISGGNGNDAIVASQGIDILTGGSGSDVFFYDSLVYPDLAIHYDRITDFEVGSDRLDISEPLNLAGYSGVDPVADGYVVVNQKSDRSLEIIFDGDGAGEQIGSTLAVLENVDAAEFQNDLSNQFIFTPTEF